MIQTRPSRESAHHNKPASAASDTPSIESARSSALTEDYVATHGVRMRTHDARGIGSLCISMHAHMPEIVAEARLHECAGGGIERLPGRA